MALGYEERRIDVGLIIHAVSFQDFQPICDPDPPTLQTVGQTDRQTDGREPTDDMQSQDRALH